MESSVKNEIIDECIKVYDKKFTWKEFTDNISEMKKYKDIVALKEIVCSDTNDTNECIKECLNAMKLDPNILKHYEFFNSLDEEEGIFKVYIETEYYPLGDLYNFIKRYDIDEGLILEFLHQIIIGLDYIHQKEFVHRDMKPQNMLLKLNEKRDGFSLAICDFGLAKSINSIKASKVGSDFYVAPEVKSRHEYNSKIDIFSFGAVLYFLLFKKERYFNDIINSEDFIESIQREIQESNYENKEIFKDLLLKCLSKDPSQRPTSKELLLYFE